jgi:PKD repeat protein
MKKIHYIFLLIIIILVAGCSQNPEASFSFTINGTTVYFDNTSSDATSYLWDFGDGNTSYETSPTHDYYGGGTYNVTLTATGKRNKSDMTSSAIDITTDLTIYNPTPTNIYIWINNGLSSSTIPAYSNLTFTGLTGESADIYAETYGETTDETTIGDILIWDLSQDLDGGLQDLTLTVSGDYFFLFITNNGGWDISPIYVNCSDVVDNPSSTFGYYVDILIPNDNVEYNTGWFSATGYGYLNVAGIWDGYYEAYGYDSWTYWYSLDLYWDSDYYRYADLLNDLYKSGKTSQGNISVPSSGKPKTIFASSNLKKNSMIIPKNAVRVISNGKKEKRRE